MKEYYFWTPTLTEVSYKFDSFRLSVLFCFFCLFVRPFATEDLRIGSTAFSVFFFYMKLDSHEVRKVAKPGFWKKFCQVGREPKKLSKNVSLGFFDKTLIHSYELFLF